MKKHKSDRVIHVREYKKFKEHALESKPESLSYTMQRAPLSRPPIALRLIFTSGKKQYVFLDFPAENSLRQTKIPIRFNKYGEAYIDDEDIRNFVPKDLGRKDLDICSMEVLGY